jgi:hypothetical protein
MEEGGDEFARGQIAAGAEDDDGAWLDRSAASVEPATQDFVQLINYFHARTMDGPARDLKPNLAGPPGQAGAGHGRAYPLLGLTVILEASTRM